MRYKNGKWKYYTFRYSPRTKWGKQEGNTENSRELMKYMLNAYRVLLTRARMGTVICVPAGNPNVSSNGYPEDSTRLPEFMMEHMNI